MPKKANRQKEIKLPLELNKPPTELTFDYIAEVLNTKYHVKYYDQYFYIWSIDKHTVGFRSSLGEGYIKLGTDPDESRRLLGKDVHELYYVLRKKYKFDTAPKQALINEVLHFFERTGLIVDTEIDKNLIYVANGTLDIKSSEVFENDVETFIPLKIPWSYIKGAECPTIDLFFDQITRRKGDKKGDNEADIQTLYEFPAYSLELGNYIKKFLLMLGAKDAGKTTFLNLIHDFIGFDNVSAINLYDFNDSFSIPSIKKMLANISDDIGYGKLTKTAMGKLNVLAGGTRGLHMRKIRQNAFKLETPRVKFLWGANEPPSINLSSTIAQAFVDRNVIEILPNKFPKNEQFPDKLKLEMSGFLNKVLESLGNIRKNVDFSKTIAGQGHDELIEIYEPHATYDIRREDEEDPDFYGEGDIDLKKKIKK